MEGVSGRGLGAGLGTAVYKACVLTRASPEEQRVNEEWPSSVFLLFFSLCAHLSSPGNMSQNLHPTMDPTKMGLGRSIAVLTSGGDAQGKQRMRRHYFDRSFVLEQLKHKMSLDRGGKSCRTASSLLMCLSTTLEPAVEALASILRGPVKYHVNALAA